MIFVFGSNESGIHGAGAARVAMTRHGYEIGQGFGPSGNAFGIPTKDWHIRSLTIPQITFYIDRFLAYTRSAGANQEFQVTQIGCGLARFHPEQIAPLFGKAPLNCFFDSEWKKFLLRHQSWGTFS